jgi:hypothetical protein
MNSTLRAAPFCLHSSPKRPCDFAGGGLSCDLGPVLLRGVDLQIGLTKRIAALPDRRHQSYVNHSYHDILTQRIYQIGCGYEDGMLYEDIYCARGQAENYIKPLKDDLAADRTSCAASSPTACVCTCMPPPMSCTSNCAPRHCSTSRCRRRSH